MNKVSFALKDPGAKHPTAILLLYSCSDGRLKYYTGQSILPYAWSAENQSTDLKGVAGQLSKITKNVYAYHDQCQVRDLPVTKAGLKNYLDDKAGKVIKKGQVDLFQAMHDVIDKMESGKILTDKKKVYAKGSIKTFRFTADFLWKFDPDLVNNRVTMETYHKFIIWCQALDYSNNYIGSQIKNWKTLGKAVGGNDIYDKEEFKKITELTFDTYLDELELSRMFELRLKDRESLVRDWFILDCFTGLRVSDLKLLTGKNYSDGFITIANEKTDEKVVIPCHRYVKEIMKRHGGFPRSITDVEINRTIKKVAKKAGIVQKLLFTITKGGKRVDEYLSKWEMVSCHTARRSFITNLRKQGVPDSIVMKLTGIKSVQTLLRYDKMSSEEAAQVASGLDFFK